MGIPAITIEGIGKRYRIGRLRQHTRTFREALTDIASRPLRRARGSDDAHPIVWALKNVSAEIPRGRVTGIIGRNGAGKSTLLKILSRITPPTTGHARVRGTVGSLLEVGSGFHGDLTGRENTYLNGAILGMRKAVIDRKFDEIIAFAEIERFIDTPVKHYSSGMYLRLAFAVAAHLEPEILLVDEVLAVGDASFQKKCLGKMEQVGAEGRTVLFVSHNMPAVLRLCDRAILLEQGSVTAEGPAPEIVRRYLRSDAGTSAERVWADPRTAPGDNCVRLKAVRVCRADGQVTETVDVREPVNVQIEYWNLDSRRRPSANIQVVNQDGIRLFVSADFNNREWRDRPRSPGVVKSTCCIPGSFLAEGQIFVTACVSSFDVSPPVGHVRERDLLAFHVVDQSDGDGARGSYGSIWPGVVRPLLDWTVQFTAMDITSGVS